MDSGGGGDDVFGEPFEFSPNTHEIGESTGNEENEEDESENDEKNENLLVEEKEEDVVSQKKRKLYRRDVVGLVENNEINDDDAAARLAELLQRNIYKKLTGHDILNMTNRDLFVTNVGAQNAALNLIEHCNYSLVLNSNLEFYLSA